MALAGLQCSGAGVCFMLLDPRRTKSGSMGLDFDISHSLGHLHLWGGQFTTVGGDLQMSATAHASPGPCRGHWRSGLPPVCYKVVQQLCPYEGAAAQAWTRVPRISRV